MLQIKIEERDSPELLFILQGELVGDSADVLIRHWNEHTLFRETRICIMDVAGVTSIDIAGELVVRYLASEGARFRVGGPMTSNIIDLVCKEKQRARQDGNRKFTSIVFCSRP